MSNKVTAKEEFAVKMGYMTGFRHGAFIWGVASGTASFIIGLLIGLVL